MTHNHKYEEVRMLLQERIREQAIGTRIPSTTELHKELGVSQQTVNRAIADLVDDGLLERHRGRGTFVSTPKLGKGDIALLWPARDELLTQDPQMMAVVHGTEQEARSLGRRVLIAADATADRSSIPEGLEGVAGALVLYNLSNSLLDALRSQRVPVVLVHPMVRRPGIPFVTADYYLGAYEATRRLVKMGHRHVAHITIRTDHSTQLTGEMLRGYEDAMDWSGLKKGCLVHAVPAYTFDRPAAEDLVHKIRRLEVTACVAFNDHIAARVIHACHEHGVRVPEDLSVVGFGDSVASETVWPPLSTVRFAADEMGQIAIRLLHDLINEGRLSGNGVTLPVEYVERRSVAPPKERIQ